MVAPYCESRSVQYGPANACVKSSTRTWSRGDCISHPYNSGLDLEKTLLRKVGEAVARFKMIRDGDRVAVALSGGKDDKTFPPDIKALLKQPKLDPAGEKKLRDFYLQKVCADTRPLFETLNSKLGSLTKEHCRHTFEKQAHSSGDETFFIERNVRFTSSQRLFVVEGRGLAEICAV